MTTFGCVTMTTFGCHHDNIWMSPWHVDVSPWQHVDVSPWQHVDVSPWQHVDVSPWQHLDVSPWQHVAVSPYNPEYAFGLIFILVGVPVMDSMLPAYMLTSLHYVLHSVSSRKLHRKNKNCTRFPSALEFFLPPVTWLVGSMYYSIKCPPKSEPSTHTRKINPQVMAQKIEFEYTANTSKGSTICRMVQSILMM